MTHGAAASVGLVWFSYCRKKLDKYICISGNLRCNEHTENVVDPVKCSQCALVIQGEVVLSVGKKMHMECFKCSYCQKALAKATAKLKDDKLCCPECMLKKDPSRRAINAAAAAAASGDTDQIDDAVRVQATPTQASGVASSPSPTAASASAASAAPAAAAAAPARSAAAASSPQPAAVIDHDAFTTYVKPVRHKRGGSKVTKVHTQATRERARTHRTHRAEQAS